MKSFKILNDPKSINTEKVLHFKYDMKVALANKSRSAGQGHEVIRVMYGNDDLDIGFCRTLRLSDNEEGKDRSGERELPPDCGPFPIYGVEDGEGLEVEKENEDEDKQDRDGFVVPAYEREGIYIKTTSSRPFAISITSSGLHPAPTSTSNPTTPKPPGAYPTTSAPSSLTTLCEFSASGNGIPQYFLVPDRALPVDTTESQLPNAASDDGGEIGKPQFSITPQLRAPFPIHIKTLDGNKYSLEVEGSLTIKKVMEMNARIVGHEISRQRLFWEKRLLGSNEKLDDIGVSMGATLFLIPTTAKPSRPELPTLNPYLTLHPSRHQNPELADSSSQNSVQELIIVSRESVVDAETPRNLLHWDNEKTLELGLSFVRAGGKKWGLKIGDGEISTPVGRELYAEFRVEFLSGWD